MLLGMGSADNQDRAKMNILVSIPRAGGMETKTVSDVRSDVTIGDLKAILADNLAVDRKSFYLAWKGRPLLDSEQPPHQLSALVPLELKLRIVGGGAGASAPRPKSSSSLQGASPGQSSLLPRIPSTPPTVRSKKLGQVRRQALPLIGSSTPADVKQQSRVKSKKEAEKNQDGKGMSSLNSLLDVLASQVESMPQKDNQLNTKGLDFNAFSKEVNKTCTAQGIDSSEYSSSVRKELFDRLDSKGNGFITTEELLAGLKRGTGQKRMLEGWAGPSNLLLSCKLPSSPESTCKQMGILDKVAELMVEHQKSRMHIESPDLFGDQLTEEDLRYAWRKAEDWVVLAFKQQIAAVRTAKKRAPDLGNVFAGNSDKFASDATNLKALTKGQYGNLKKDFRSGVEGALGLPGKDIHDGMKMEFCSSEDSEKTFKTANGHTITTPKQEYEFVVKPDWEKRYPGDRTPTPLKHFLYAACARKANSDDEGDVFGYDKVKKTLKRLEELEDPDLRNGVKMVLLQRVREVGLSHLLLAAAATADSDFQSLGKVAHYPEHKLKTIDKNIQNMLNSSTAQRRNDKRLGRGRSPRFEQMLKVFNEQNVDGLGLTAEELDALLEVTRRDLKSANLLEEEIIALRLYTGPAYMKMNDILRKKSGDSDGEVLENIGNDYVNTIFAAVSGMVKLAEISPIPPDRVVFRGMQGMSLPSELFEDADAQGAKGGAELAFLSTTTDIEVAKRYAQGGDLPIVFTIQVGAVDKGAALGFISQYPNENEILMPPRSFLELVGDVKLDSTTGGYLVPVKLNCNLFCPTLEKLRASRKEALVNTLKHMRKEIARDVDETLEKEEVKERASQDIFWTGYRDRYVKSIKEEISKALQAATRRPPSWYNVDVQFRRAMQEALLAQKKAMGKLKLWLDDRNLYVYWLVDKNGRECDRMATGRHLRQIEEVDIRIKQLDFNQTESEKLHHQLDHFELQRKGLLTKLCRHLDLIYKEVDERLETSDGETALMLQAAEGREDYVSLLLRAGADMYLARKGGMTALHLAAEGGHHAVVKTLLDTVRSKLKISEVLENSNGEDTDHSVFKRAVNVLTDSGQTPIVFAARNGHTMTVQLLKDEFKADWTTPDVQGWNAVHEAAYDGHLHTLKVLLSGNDSDAMVNRANNDGFTACMMAAQNGHEEVVQWLVEEKQADLQVANNEGKTAFLCAAADGWEGVVKLLGGNPHVDIHARTRDGSTALMLTAKKGKEQLVKWLIRDKGADINAVNNHGITALLNAVEWGHENLVRWLEERGADIKASTNEGKTALIQAAEKGHLGVCKFLVNSREADVNASMRDDTTALIAAAENGQADVMRWLVGEKRADVQAKNKAGKTALLAVALTGDLNVVRWLIEEQGAKLDAEETDDANARVAAGGASKSERDDKAKRVQDLESHTTLADIGIDVKPAHGTLLINAASNGHEELVKWLVVDKEVPLEKANHEGTTALLAAAQSGHLALVKWLLSDSDDDRKSANIFAKQNNGRTVLMLACLSGQLELVKWLVQKFEAEQYTEGGVKDLLNEQDDDGWTAVVCAAQPGFESTERTSASMTYEAALFMVQWLVEQGADLKHTQRKDGWTVLLGAAKNGNLGLVRWVVERYSPSENILNKATKDEWTPLMLAARSGKDEANKRLVEWLVKNRADVTRTNKHGQTALECAALLGNFEVVKLLLDAEAKSDMDVSKAKAGKGDKTTLLMCAAQSRHEEMVKWLAEHQKIADINATTTSGKTVLQIAADLGQLGLAKWLVDPPEEARRFISKPADPNQCNNDGETPLMLAAASGHEDFVAWLSTEHDVELETKDMKGRTAMLKAAKNGRHAVVRALCTPEIPPFKQANLMVKDKKNNTALHLAAKNGLEGLLRWLVVDRNMDLEARNNLGQTPFMCAASKGREGAMRFLQWSGADVNIQQTDGRTALMLLVEDEQERLVEWMTTATKVDVNVVDSHGKTALMYAAERGFLEVAKKLALVTDASVDSGSLFDENDRRSQLIISQKDDEGFNACMHACKNGEVAMAKWLLKEQQANADACTAEGWTPLTLTVAHGTLAQLKVLIDVGKATLEGVDQAREPRGGGLKVPLLLAVERDLETVKRLQKYGEERCDVSVGVTVRDAKDRYGKNTVMAWAAVAVKDKRADAQMFKYLVDKNADVNAVDIFGNNALMYAVNSRQEDKVQVLLENNVMADQKNKLGWNALHLAVLTKQQDALRSLLPAAKSEVVRNELGQLRKALPVVLHRGEPMSAHLDRQHRVTFIKCSTVRSRDPFPVGNPFYELKILDPLLEPRLGFASAAMVPCYTDTDVGVGDDDTAWSIGGSTRTKASLVAGNESGQLNEVDFNWDKWARDDVIGLFCNLATKEMSVWHNGEPWPKEGVVFKIGSESEPAPNQVFAAFSAKSGAAEYNFGDKGWKFPKSLPKDCVSFGAAAFVAQACAMPAVQAADRASTERIKGRSSAVPNTEEFSVESRLPTAASLPVPPSPAVEPKAQKAREGREKLASFVTRKSKDSASEAAERTSGGTVTPRSGAATRKTGSGTPNGRTSRSGTAMPKTGDSKSHAQQALERARSKLLVVEPAARERSDSL